MVLEEYVDCGVTGNYHSEEYDELKDYLNHQDSWIEQELGEGLTYAIKAENEENGVE